MTSEAPYNDESYTVSGVDYTFRFAINQRKPIGQFAAAVARSASATVPPALVVPEAEQEPQRVADSQWNETEHDFARDEAASAIVRAVQRWREALAGMSNNDIDNALDAVWEAGETLDALRED